MVVDHQVVTKLAVPTKFGRFPFIMGEYISECINAWSGQNSILRFILGSGHFCLERKYTKYPQATERNYIGMKDMPCISMRLWKKQKGKRQNALNNVLPFHISIQLVVSTQQLITKVQKGNQWTKKGKIEMILMSMLFSHESTLQIAVFSVNKEEASGSMTFRSWYRLFCLFC